MSKEAFGRFVAEATESSALSNVKSASWPEEDALAKSQAEFERLLPEGLSIPDHHLLEGRYSQSAPPLVTAGGLVPRSLIYQRPSFLTTLMQSEGWSKTWN